MSTASDIISTKISGEIINGADVNSFSIDRMSGEAKVGILQKTVEGGVDPSRCSTLFAAMTETEEDLSGIMAVGGVDTLANVVPVLAVDVAASGETKDYSSSLIKNTMEMAAATGKMPSLVAKIADQASGPGILKTLQTQLMGEGVGEVLSEAIRGLDPEIINEIEDSNGLDGCEQVVEAAPLPEPQQQSYSR